MRYLLLFCSFVLFAIPYFAQGQTVPPSSLKMEADSLYRSFEENKALELYRQILEDQPEDYESLWKASFLYARIGNRLKAKENQKDFFQKAENLAERALEVDSSDAQSHFVMAVAMGRMALISGARDRVAASRSIKKHVDRALAFDSTHAGAWHVLGRWNFKVANLSFVERVAANTLFGGIPGDASNEKAAEAIEKAIQYNDRYLLYYHDLAMVYDKMGREEEAITACRKAIDMQNLTPDDPRLKAECEDWIEDWQ